MLNFASTEINEWRETNHDFQYVSPTLPIAQGAKPGAVKILAEKISVPSGSAEIERSRIVAHLEKSLASFSATLVTGRVGTGKTALAASFAKQKNYRVAWYKTEATDGDWEVFASYLAETLRSLQSDYQLSEAGARVPERSELTVTEFLAAQFAALVTDKPLLIVLDDLHSVFDASWFAEFFNALLSLPMPNVRLLLLARSAPPLPLWRLRSKHVLDVIDEKLLAFTTAETTELFQSYGLSEKASLVAHKRAYGRIVKLREIAVKKSIR